MQPDSTPVITSVHPQKDGSGNQNEATVYSQTNGASAKPIRLPSNWDDIKSVDRMKDAITELLSKSALSEEDIYSMYNSSSAALELIEHLRFGQLSLVCDVVIDPYGRRCYHAKKAPKKKDEIKPKPKPIDTKAKPNKVSSKPKDHVLDPELQREIAVVISALSEPEIDRLRSKVLADMSRANDGKDFDEESPIYQCINGIIHKRDRKRKRAADKLDTKPLQVASKSIEIVPPDTKKKQSQPQTLPPPQPMQRLQVASKSVEIPPPEATEPKETSVEIAPVETKETLQAVEIASETKESLKDIQTEHEKTVLKLQEIILRKNDKIQEMIVMSNQQTELIRSLSKEEEVRIIEEDSSDDYDDTGRDDEIDECVQIVKVLKYKMSAFKANYNVLKVDGMSETDREMLVDTDSSFINKLNQYSQVMKAMSACVSDFCAAIDGIETYIENKCIPNVKEYEQWTLDDVMIWIKCLENGRFEKHSDQLLFGFRISQILTGELLPDLSIADLSVAPFNITHFSDKRDLIQHFKTLRGSEQ